MYDICALHYATRFKVTSPIHRPLPVFQEGVCSIDGSGMGDKATSKGAVLASAPVVKDQGYSITVGVLDRPRKPYNIIHSLASAPACYSASPLQVNLAKIWGRSKASRVYPVWRMYDIVYTVLISIM